MVYTIVITMALLLFTTPSCPNCPAAKDLLALKGMDYELIDASKPEGLAAARKYGVSSVPTIVKTDDDGTMLDSARGFESIQEMLSEM